MGSVSIRSPRRNEGRRLVGVVGFVLALVSIRSPRRNEGRRGGLKRLMRQLLVSIRSPRRNEGRQTRGSIYTNACVFQSAPPAETRGDPRGAISGRDATRFNPLPPPKRGETVQRPTMRI